MLILEVVLEVIETLVLIDLFVFERGVGEFTSGCKTLDPFLILLLMYRLLAVGNIQSGAHIVQVLPMVVWNGTINKASIRG